MPRNPDIILSLKAARERDKDTLSRSLARGHDVAAGLFPVRHRPGWHPASDPVVGLRAHAPDVYRGRDYAALTEAAKRKPRTEDDVLREKFGGGGTVGAAPRSREGEKTLAAPSSDDLYEPVGTMPVVGDTVVPREGAVKFMFDNRDVFRIVSVAEDGTLRGELVTPREGFGGWSQIAEPLVRVLKRKPTPALKDSVVPRAWIGRDSSMSRYLWDGHTMRYSRTKTLGWSLCAVVARPGDMESCLELPLGEAMVLWAECKKVLGLEGASND